MTGHPHKAPTHGSGRGARRLSAWRVGTPLVILICGGLFVVSAQNSEGTDLRPGRYTDLATVTGSEKLRYTHLEERVAQTDKEVSRLTQQVDDNTVKRYKREVDELKDPAGLVAHSGPGVRITLSDAPQDKLEKVGDQAANVLVVHQQDVQAVVNALWRGGANAVTIQGQRVISTTGIKCSGSTIQLQGVPYPQPFVIEAVGNPADLTRSIDDDAYVKVYRDQAANPDIAIGWGMQERSRVTAPAYGGLRDLTYARPID
ncbi:DUF881 domain-containing protein [Nocardioides sp. CER19]|uniref:DUF881 domain-containing protein n=1 Tax=Nocardioides sp. CER19 TaxID=3038538 RepID=UPI002447B4E3|nr:DUF881 domain-containing protein [Nocardioides sp. CER19]MDH2412779.1 DUF881 domain-containing protein [Nocardioides sp. CER19]